MAQAANLKEMMEQVKFLGMWNVPLSWELLHPDLVMEPGCQNGWRSRCVDLMIQASKGCFDERLRAGSTQWTRKGSIYRPRLKTVSRHSSVSPSTVYQTMPLC